VSFGNIQDWKEYRESRGRKILYSISSDGTSCGNVNEDYTGIKLLFEKYFDVVYIQ
jgi:hypothetical protein